MISLLKVLQINTMILGAASGEDIAIITELAENNNKNYFFYAIEPNTIWIDNLKLFKNTIVLNAAVSSYNYKTIFLSFNKLDDIRGGSIINKSNFNIEVSNVKLSTLLNKIKNIDLLSMDIQFAEEMVLTESISSLNKYVSYLNIFTHSELLENNIYNLLINNKWKNIVYIPKKINFIIKSMVYKFG